MSRSAACAVVLCAVLLSACGSREPKLERLPPAEMRDVLPPPSLSSAPEPAPAAAPPAAGALPGGAAAAAATDSEPEAAAESTPGDAGPSQEFTISLSKGDEAPAVPAAAPRTAEDVGWPRSFAATGVAFEVHQPQVQSWDGSNLVADAAVVAQPDGQDQPVPGVVRMTASTVVYEAAGTVALDALTLTDARFPGALDREQAWLDLLRSFTSRSVKRLQLAHVQASAAQAEALKKSDAAAKAATPRIIVARNPAVLASVDGEPRFVAVPGTDLQGVRNTRVVLLKDPAGKLYLRLYDGWVSAASLRGPWSIAKAPPGADRALQAAIDSGRANLLVGKPDSKTGKRPTLSGKTVPLIVVSAQPAVLAGVSGEPKFAPISGTGLQYVTNTQAHIFRENKSKKLYVLAGGRWFQGASMRGPFEPIAADKLPADFARVPADARNGDVAASMVNKGASAPGSEPPLPTLVAVGRDQARFNVVIDGDPKLEPIAGTQLNYVANASAPIIQVDIDNWYGAQNGVWFEARTATGPWTLTDNVPAAIYGIPPTAPVYHAVHSRVYASSSDTVYYGYATEGFAASGGAMGPSESGEDYQATPPGGLVWGWFY
jgi:hypothetical protein